MKDMLAEKFVGIISIISEFEIDGEIFQALDTLESDPVDTYEEAVDFIHKKQDIDGFHHAQVKKVFVKA
jgi:hypothetical protein